MASLASMYGGNSTHSPSNKKYDEGYVLPAQGSSASKFKTFFERVIDYDSPARIEQIREWNIARAFYLSHQWLDLDTSRGDQTRAVRFSDPRQGQKRIPKPVTNEILPIVDNEVAKLYRRRSTAYVRPVALQVGTGGAAGAAVANDIMEWHLETIDWPQKRRTAIMRDVLYGTAYFWSYLDQNYMDSVRLGITSARQCVNDSCGAMLSDLSIPSQGFEKSKYFGHEERYATLVKFNKDIGDVEPQYKAKKCLACGAPLRKYIPIDDEIDGEDLFGRELFAEHPKNSPNVEIPSVYDIFPENEGIGFDTPNDVKVWYRCTPRSISHWIASHYPDMVKDVQPDDANYISERHPVVGGYGTSDMFGAVGNRALWRNYALVKTAIVEPCPEYRRGRFVEMAGRVLLRDEELYRESKDPKRKGLLIPLVQVAAARFFVKDGEVNGQGIVKPLVSPQNRVNMTYSQIIDTRQRNGVSGILATQGTQLVSGWLEGFTGRIVRWKPDAMYPHIKPEFIQASMIDSAIYQELDRTIERMQQIAGAQDVDLGKAPRNVSAATAIQILQEQASGRREGREQELIDAFKKVYSHQLLLHSEFTIEPREYRVQAQNGKWEYRQFLGLDLAGHTDVMVEEQAGYDARAFEREALAQAIQIGVVVISTPYARREAAKAFGISAKVSDEENTQISDCEGKWYAFRDNLEVPTIDPSLDDHWLMFSVYGRFLKSSEGQSLAKQYQWPETLRLIAGWEVKLEEAIALAEQIKQLAAQAQSNPMAQMSLQAFMLSTGETPLSVQLPEDEQDKILYTWARMGADPANPFNQFRAVVEGHKRLGEKKKMEAMMGPRFSAPGGAQTPAGTEPVLGSMPIPGPGEANAGIPTPDGAEAPEEVMQ
jgi:hypothetical protein